MSSVMDYAISTADPARWSSIIANATIYRAQVGRRRAFRSLRDAELYTEGFVNFPEVPAHHGPAMCGYFDAELDDELRRDMQMERAAERSAQ